MKKNSRSDSRSRSRDRQKNRRQYDRDRQSYKNRDNRHHRDYKQRQRDHKEKDRDTYRYRDHKDKQRQRDHKQRQYKDRDREKINRDRQYKQRQHHKHHSPKNKKRQYSSSSSSSSSGSKSRSRSKERSRSKNSSNMSSNEKQKRSRSRSKDRNKNQGRYDKEVDRDRDKDRERDRDRDRDRDRERQKDNESQRSYEIKNYKREQNQSIQPRYKIEQTKTLKIQNCVQRQAAQRALTDASIHAGTSVPDEVQLRQGSIYAKYPSIQVSSTIKQLLKQKIIINSMQYQVNYYPYKRIDLNIAYDWYCQKCQYKNFARRHKCYRCQSQKTPNCKLNYSSTSSSIIPVRDRDKGKNNANKQENINNCSLMVRGPVVMEIEEEMLLELFEGFCDVKDIRMIRNKMTGQLKDFAFVQFFTPQDAALALRNASSSDFRVRGEKVSVMYSRNKSQDQYSKPLPYQKKQRKRDFPGNPSKKDKSSQPVQSYYSRQRQLQIQQQKQRPIITIEQLKQKREQQLKKKAANARQLTQQQAKRRQAQLLAKQWEKEARMQNTVLYICVLCRRKFKSEADMKLHGDNSDLHRYNKQRVQLSL